MGSRYDDKFAPVRRIYSRPGAGEVPEGQISFEQFQREMRSGLPSGYGGKGKFEEVGPGREGGGQPERARRAAELVKRGKPCLKWVRNEYRIAREVFKDKPALQARKLAEREAVGVWVKEVMALLKELAAEAETGADNDVISVEERRSS